ncbi:MAG: 7TM diverse intracellular signaling domain-containing protein [Thermodesulfobacteriota bacterium]
MQRFTIIWLFLFYFAGAAIAPLCLGSDAERELPRAVRGVIDLRHWDFEQDGPVELNGEYEFFWQQHLGPSDFADRTIPMASNFIGIPGYWKGMEMGAEKLSGHGFATYRLRILLKGGDQALALKLFHIGTAFTIFLNGEKMGATGAAGKTPAATVPRYFPQTIDFVNQTEQAELIFQVSNFHHRRGGIWEAVTLGRKKDIQALRERQLGLDLFLLGCIFIMALYHLGLFALQPKNRSPLYFSLFCFLIVIRLLTTGERYLTHLFPDIGWEVLMKLEYSWYLSVPMFGLFMRSLFQEFSKYFCRFTIITGLVFSGLVFFTPARIYTHTLPVYQVVTLLTIIYGFYVLIFAAVHQRQGAWVFLIGFIILAVTVANDMLHVAKFVQTGYFMPFGLFAFIFSQSLLHSLRLSNAFNTVEMQLGELRKAYQAYRKEITGRLQAERALHDAEEQAQQHQRQLMQADKMVALGTLVSGVAHEVNNPNNFIMLNTPVLKEAWRDAYPILEKYYAENGDFLMAGVPYSEMREKTVALFSGISDGSLRIKRIVDDLKNYVRDDAGDLEQLVDLNKVLKSTISLVANMIEKATNRFEITYGDNLPKLRGSFQRLEQVMVNLIQNACQALPDKNRGISVVTIWDQKQSQLIVTIKDEGIGIERDILPHVTDPFFTTKFDSGGVGLGLSVSSMIIEEHGGTLSFTSVPGSGTSVDVRLPMNRNDSEVGS